MHTLPETDTLSQPTATERGVFYCLEGCGVVIGRDGYGAKKPRPCCVCRAMLDRAAHRERRQQRAIENRRAPKHQTKAAS